MCVVRFYRDKNGKPNAKTTSMWGWFIAPISGDLKDGLWVYQIYIDLPDIFYGVYMCIPPISSFFLTSSSILSPFWGFDQVHMLKPQVLANIEVREVLTANAF